MKLRHIFVLAILGLFAVIVSLYTTSTGTGLGPDSYVYVASSRSLLAGNGIRIPQGPDGSVYTAHFPPLYAIMLALSSLGILEPVVTARWLNALFFGANMFLVSLSIWQLTSGSFAAALLGGLLFFGSAELLLIHAQVWSEAPFYFFMLLGLVLLSRSLAAPSLTTSKEATRQASPIPSHAIPHLPSLRSIFRKQEIPLLLAAVAISIACLVRYAGVTLILVGVLALLLHNGSDLRERLRRTLIFLAFSAGPLGIWMIYNLAEAGSLTNRSLSRHPVDLRDFRQGLDTVTGWLFPGVEFGLWLEAITLAAIISGLALLGASLLRTLRLPGNNEYLPAFLRRDPHRRFPSSTGLQTESQPVQPSPDIHLLPYALFTLSYFAFLILSLSLFDAQTSLDARILSPAYISLLILVISALTRWLPGTRKVIRWTTIVLLLVFTAAQIISGARMAAKLVAGENKGYTSAYWADSRLLQQVGGLPASIPIYSNGADVIYLLTGKPAIGIPREISPNTLKVNQRFEVEMLQMRQALEEDHAVLVLFYELEERRRYLPSEYELNELLPLKRITRWKNEGALYRIQGGEE